MYARVARQLYATLREDPTRIRFPFYNNNHKIPTKDLARVRKELQLSDGVYLAHIDKNA